MVRVPTYMSHVNRLTQTLSNKKMFDLYNFQSLTGLKAPTYAGYGKSAYNIVSLEASLSITSNFLENNKLIMTETKLMNTSLTSVYKNVTNFKSSLLNFSSCDLNVITPDYTGGELVFGNNNPADYLGKTITIEGTQYTFANDSTGNNIDISTATNGEDVMNALKAKLPTNPEFVFDGNKFNFPLYTINGTSSVLNTSGVTTGEPKTVDTDQTQALAQLQGVAFAAMLAMVDALNISANGKYLFGGGNSSSAPINFPFKNLQEFQDYYDGVNVSYPTTENSNLTTRYVSASDTGDLTLASTGLNTGTITATNAGAFLQEAVVANADSTGDLTFSAINNTIKATQYGAFNTVRAGDTLIIEGAGGNDKMYVVKSVSQDGKTITIDDSTSIPSDMTISPNNDVNFSTSFPIGAVVDMNGFGVNVADRVQVTGVSDDGKTLYVTADPDKFPTTPTTFVASNKISMQCSSYYQGESISYEKRVSDSQTLVFDINANDPVFEKIFRALGEIAQGNVIDNRNPADELDGLIDPKGTLNKVESALDLIYDAVFAPNNKTNAKNVDLNSVMAKMSANVSLLTNLEETQTLTVNNLQTDISSLKEADETESAVKALMAKQNLEASYSVLQSALEMSLLNYLK